MKNVLKAEMNRAFRVRSIVPPILLGIIICVIGIMSYFDGPRNIPGAPTFLYNAYDAWFFAVGRGPSAIFSGIAPLLAVWAFADSYSLDRTSGYLRYVLLRTTHARYLTAKLVANALVGGLIVGLPLLLAFGITSLLLPHGLPPIENAPFNPTGPISDLYREAPSMYILIYCGVGFLFGTTYATLGLTISSIANNRYLVLATPFLLYQITNFFFAVFGLARWAPPNTLTPYLVNNTSWITVFGELGAILIISSVWIWIFSKKREVFV